MPRGKTIYRYTCPNPACNLAMARWDVFQRHVAGCNIPMEDAHDNQDAVPDRERPGRADGAQYWDWGPSVEHSASVETPHAAAWAAIGGGPAFEEEVRAMTAFLDNTCRPIVRAVCKNTAIEYEPVKEYWDRRMRIMAGKKQWFILLV